MGSGSSKLAPETAGKLQASTHFDKKEINQLYSSFIKECPSGRMSRDDLSKIYRQFFPFGNSSPFIDRLIQITSSADNLNNGIEFAEYVTGLSVISRGRLDEKLFWAFKYCDFDGDGWISKTDLFESIELVHQLMGNLFQFSTTTDPNPDATTTDIIQNEPFSSTNRTDQLFLVMDQDNDGRADFSDFKRTVLGDPEIIQGFLVYDGVI